MAMDLTTATSAIAVEAATRRSPDSDSETPRRPTASKPMGFLAYANGALKRHYPTAPPPPKPDSPASAAARTPEVSYKECMRNHAASIGGHALDGCCEFMPLPTFNPSDPTSLRCAACACHRNFHRRDPDDPAPLQLHRQTKSPFGCAPPPKSPSSPPAPATSPFFSSAPHMLMALKNPAGTAPATAPAATNGGGKHSAGCGGGKKRFRTKFSQEQKEKMYEFSEKLGWKLQKIDKGVVEEFCNEVGVGKEVLKVWMHNNKNTLGRKESINGGNGMIGGHRTDKNGDHGFYSADGEEEKMGRNDGEGHNGGHFDHVHQGSADGSSSSG